MQLDANRTGSAISGALIVEGLVREGWNVNAVFGMEGPMLEQYRTLGCEVTVIHHKSWLRGGGPIRSTRRILGQLRIAGIFKRLMSEHPPDVVYVNSLVSLAGAWASRSLDIPCVWHIRELFDDVGGEMRRPALGGKLLVRWILRRCSKKLIVISQAVAENVPGNEWRQETAVIPNAVEDVFFEFGGDQPRCRRLFGIQENVMVVGVAGSISPVKGQLFLFRAMPMVLEKHPDTIIALAGAGEGRYRSEIEQIAEYCGFRDRVLFLGPVKHMAAFYRACDILCVPSRSESFGRIIIEAFATGTPVVATAVGGIPEIIEDGETGVLVPFGDVKALSDSISNLLSDDEKRNALTAAASRKADLEYRAAGYQERICAVAASAAE